MQDQNTYLLEPVPNLFQVVQLSPRDAGAIDPQVVQAIIDAFDPELAEAHLSNAIDEVTQVTSTIAALFRQNAFADLPTYARRLIHVADSLGLTEMSLVGEHLISCARSDDIMAVAAIISRLQRLCDRAADDLWSIAIA